MKIASIYGIVILLLVSGLSRASVDFTISSPSPGLITIGYRATTGEGVRGIALTIHLSHGATAVYTDIVSIHPAFNTFIDYAYAVMSPDIYEIGDGHPFAYPNQPGPLEEPASYFTLSMGSLDISGNQDPAPAIVDNLITFRVQDGGAGYTSLTLGEDMSVYGDLLRGGVVGDNIDTVTFSFAQPFLMMTAQSALPLTELIVNDGNNCFAGKIVEIHWDNTLDDYIKLQYSTDSGSYWHDLNHAIYLAGPVYWKIPNGIDSKNCLVRAVSPDETSLIGQSDSLFSIRPCSVEMDFTGDCFVNFHDLALFASQWMMGEGYGN